jgi:hypothetical protein
LTGLVSLPSTPGVATTSVVFDSTLYESGPALGPTLAPTEMNTVALL